MNNTHKISLSDRGILLDYFFIINDIEKFKNKKKGE